MQRARIAFLAASLTAFFASATFLHSADMSTGSVAPSFALAALAVAPPPHPTRERILRHLRMLPGDHLRSIARVLRVSVSEASYHLHVLWRSGIVREEKVRNRVRYYLVDSESEADRNTLFRKHWAHRDLRARVLHAVEAHAPVRPAELAKTIGISRQLATYHLSHLAASGHVARDGPHYLPSAPSEDSQRPDTDAWSRESLR